MKKNPTKRLPKPRANAKSAPNTPLGILLHKTRVQKNIAQREIANAISKKLGGSPNNARVSVIELGKKVATDDELAIFANILGLSLPTLRAKRAESKPAIKAWARKEYAQKLAPKSPERVAAKLGRAREPEPAGVPALSDFIDLIDGIVPMPAEKDARKRWLASTMELFKIGGK